MLTAYRRHLQRCKFTLRPEKKCQCPVWIQGTLNGVWMKKSLGIRNWESAQKVIRDMEAGESVEHIPLQTAGEKFIADCKARHLGAAVGKYNLLTRELNQFFGNRIIGTISVDDLSGYRQTWKLSPITASKKLGNLRSFFKFANERGWIEKNPASQLTPPRVKQTPTLPFTNSEFDKILSAVDSFADRPTGRRNQLRTFILVLRYSGLRIGDAVKLQYSNVSDGKLFLHTQKTGQRVWIPLPLHVREALQKLQSSTTDSEYFFWRTGNGSLKSAVSVWQRSLAKLFKLAGISGHAHRFRDTFAVDLLSRDVSLENVSILLAHENIRITQKHYAPWVQSRQEALEAAVSRAWASVSSGG